MNANSNLSNVDENTGEIVALEERLSALTRQQLDAPITFAEAMQELGLAQAEMVLVGSAYTVERDKDKLLSEPFYIREVRFATDETSEQDYAVMYLVTAKDEQLIITDGSTGIYRTISFAVKQRIDEGHPTPYNGYIIPNGLRKSEYPIHKDGTPLSKREIAAGVKASGKASTYYFA